jgi:hypothetical protein
LFINEHKCSEQRRETREQRGESREETAEMREQIESREQRAQSIQQRAESREQRAESREQRKAARSFCYPALGTLWPLEAFSPPSMVGERLLGAEAEKMFVGFICMQRAGSVACRN